MRFKKIPTYFFFILPSILILIFLVGYPIVSAVISSFQYISKEEFSYNLNNYAKLMEDSFFVRSITITLTFTILTIIANISSGLILSLMFGSGIKFQKFFFTLFMIPMLISGTSAAVMWRLFYNMGYMNLPLNLLGLPKVYWLSDPNTALYSLVIMSFWQGAPLMMLFLYAGLVSIKTSLFEAARIDGASRIQTFRYITFPLLKPVLLTTIILNTIVSFKQFDYVYVTTGGGPGNATITLSYYIYKMAFGWVRFELASAGAVISLIIILVLSIFYVRMLQK